MENVTDRVVDCRRSVHFMKKLYLNFFSDCSKFRICNSCIALILLSAIKFKTREFILQLFSV